MQGVFFSGILEADYCKTADLGLLTPPFCKLSKESMLGTDGEICSYMDSRT